MSGDYDPRDFDSRDRDGIHDREDEWLVLGRVPTVEDVRDGTLEHQSRDRDEDWRDVRDRDPRDRDDERGGLDPRDVFMRNLDLPDSRERELVHERDRDYTLNGSDTRTHSAVGAFRVVSERDLRDPRDAAYDERADLRHLEKQGLIEHVPLDGRDRAVVLTDRGRSLLEGHRRDRDPNHRQEFYEVLTELASGRTMCSSIAPT